MDRPIINSLTLPESLEPLALQVITHVFCPSYQPFQDGAEIVPLICKNLGDRFFSWNRNIQSNCKFVFLHQLFLFGQHSQLKADCHD